MVPQYPLRTGMTLSFACMIAPLIAVATSLLHLIPSPTCPSPSPTTTNALNLEIAHISVCSDVCVYSVAISCSYLVLCPALVCFCTGMIFMTSSFNLGRNLSTI